MSLKLTPPRAISPALMDLEKKNEETNKNRKNME